MFQPLSAYTVAPQMQQQQNLADALRSTSPSPVDQSQATNTALSALAPSRAPGMAAGMSPLLRGMVGQMAMQAQSNPGIAAMDNPAVRAIAANNQSSMGYLTPGQGGG